MVRRKSQPSKDRVSDVKDDDTNKRRSRNTNVTIYMKNTGQRSIMKRKLYKEIRYLQSRTSLLIPKLPFSRLIREIVMDVGRNPEIRVQSVALKALQEACEMYMVQYFEDSYLCTLHARRKTLNIKDMQLTRRLRGRYDIINH